MVLEAVQDVRPDVTAHLAAAARELTLALRAATASDSGSGRPSATASDTDGAGEPAIGADPAADDSARPRAGTPRLRRIALD